VEQTQANLPLEIHRNRDAAMKVLKARLYDQKMKLALMSDITRPELKARALKAKAETRAEMYALARQVLAGQPHGLALPDHASARQQQAGIDAVRAGVIGQDELPAAALEVLGATHSSRINTLVSDLVGRSADGLEIGLSDDVFRALDALREFLFDHVYLRDEARSEQDKAISMVRSLFAHYLDHPDEVPQEYHRAAGDPPTRVADYIAGMTDRYALRIYEQLFLPQRWLL